MSYRTLFFRCCTVALVASLVLGSIHFNLAGRALAAALSDLNAVSAASVPNYVNFQGVVRDADGKRLTGSYDMIFAVFDQPVAGNQLWSETQTGLTARDGDFSALLGTVTAFPANLFSSADRYVSITVNGVEMQPRQRFASVPYAFQAQNGVPVGTVIDWWRPDANTPLPEGYLICNGQTVNDAQSPLNGKALPNLNNAFVRGTTDPNAIGATGGAATHHHSINHDHAAVTTKTSPAGHHNHGYSYFNGQDYYTYNRAGAMVLAEDWGDGMDNAGAGVYVAGLESLRAAQPNDAWAFTDTAPDHQHDVTVDLPAYTGDSGEASSLPPYVQLLKLCRVK
ncbi:MAG: hypothetical protein U0175_23660 [Caldilineaceae bacterium]